MRAVAHDRHAVSLSSEVAAAVTVLQDAGIRTTVNVDVGDLSAEADAVLAWAVREAATNILRHSDARECLVSATVANGALRLEVTNDGALDVTDTRTGQGLAGIRDRVRAMAGTAEGSRLAGGSFRLSVEIPLVQT
jgi:two-component system, NarL family, sensor histidine kinase DesK